MLMPIAAALSILPALSGLGVASAVIQESDGEVLPPPEVEAAIEDHHHDHHDDGHHHGEHFHADHDPNGSIDLVEITDDGPIAFEDVSDEDVFAQAAESIQSISTLRARFEQESPSGETYTGVVSLARPGRLRFDYDEPSPQLIVAAGGLVYVHDSDLETTDSYPVGKTPLRFLLDREIATDEAVLNGVYRTEDGVAVVIQATDEELQGELALVFDAADMQLREWAVMEPDGRVTRVALSEVETGVRLPGRLFRAPVDNGRFLD